MSSELRNGSTIKDDGWRQGSALPAKLAATLADKGRLPWVASADDVLIVVSHDCDVTNADLAIEPSVEVLRLQKVAEENGNLTWGKNPRRYQFTDRRKSPPAVFEASVHDRVTIPRCHLIGYKPDDSQTVDGETRSRICRWITNRYVRAAFPDSFNRRMEPAMNQLRKAFKSGAQDVSGIYLIIENIELSAAEVYKVVLAATMQDSHYHDSKKKAAVQSLLTRVEGIFQACVQGVDFVIALRSESDVSLHELRILKRWDFDDLSLRQGLVQDLPPNS